MMLLIYAEMKALQPCLKEQGDIPMSCKLQEWFQGKCMASGNHIRADVFPSGRGLAADGERQALEKL